MLAGGVLGVVLVAWQVSEFRSFLDTLGRNHPEPPRVEAIVALAGAAGRLDRGLDLLLEGKADILLLSGTGPGATIQEIFPGRDLSRLERGKVILLENRSTSTYENAIEAWAVLSALRAYPGASPGPPAALRANPGASPGPPAALRANPGAPTGVVLLTSNYHMVRSVYVFRKVFPEDVRIHPYPVVREEVVPGAWWRDGRARKLVLMEYLKYLWYRVRY